MVLPRSSLIRGAVRQVTFRGARPRARGQAWRHIGRRTYASEHGSEKSSDIPWLIGSLVVTVPSAAWLWQQGPTKSEHGHGDGAHEEAHDASEESEDKGGEDQNEDGEKEVKKDEGGDDEDSKDDSQDKKSDDSKDEGKSEDSDSEGDEGKDTPPTSDDDEESDSPSPGSPGQINKNSSKGPGEGQKGPRREAEKKGSKDAAGDYSGADHPYMDEPGKSKKGSGVTETAKIHGSVDTTKSSK